MKYYLYEIRKSFDKRGYFYFISFMLMASTFLPLVTVNVRFIANELWWSYIWLFSLIVFKPQIFQNKLFLFVLLYGLIFLILLNTLWVNVDEWNKYHITEELYIILVAVSVLTYFRIEQDYFRFAKLVKWTMIFIFITAVLSIVVSLMDPMYVRNLTGINNFKLNSVVETILSYRKYGGGDYSFASGLVCLFPMLIYYFKNNHKCIIKKQYILIIAIVFFFALLRMQIFANILISLLIIIFSISGTKNLKINLFISSFVIAAILFIPTQFYIDIMIYVSTWFPSNSEIHIKLNETSKFLLGNYAGSDITVRADRYPLLQKAFIANPLLGHFISGRSNDILLGFHLYWMNKLAVYGLLGTIPFLFIIYNFIKESMKYFDKEFTFDFMLSIFSILALGLMKVLIGRGTWYAFFIIVPGLYYLPLLKKRDKQYSNTRQNGINLQYNKD